MNRMRRHRTRSLTWGMPHSGAPATGAAVGMAPVMAASAANGSAVNTRENQHLGQYETAVKQSFDRIESVLRQVSALQHEADFIQRAQQLAVRELGFELPAAQLESAWIDGLDMRSLYAACVFENYRLFCDDFFGNDPLGDSDAELERFDQFLQSCGFHILDISPCADGRLAHLIRYVLRLPYRRVRRKSYAGAMFDVDDSIQKWVETELLRYREGRPNTADAPTRYLKVLAYHFSEADPDHGGCAAHGSDTRKAATAGLERLLAFQQAIENTFCCGASIDLLLIGVNTDTDAIRLHVPDGEGRMDIDRYLDMAKLYPTVVHMPAGQLEATLTEALRACSPDCPTGMLQLLLRLARGNLSQIDYVRQRHGGNYPDIDHAERFIGAGIGFEEIQLRNLTYFAYLHTVEEAANDVDVGIKIFSKLNVKRGLPVPIVVRFDYHGHVPGARQRAEDNCARVARALHQRFDTLSRNGLLHTLQAVRDCAAGASIEVLSSSADQPMARGGTA